MKGLSAWHSSCPRTGGGRGERLGGTVTVPVTPKCPPRGRADSDLGPSLGGEGQGRARWHQAWGRPGPAPQGPHLESGEADGLERVEAEGDAQRILEDPGPPGGWRGVSPWDGAAPTAATHQVPSCSVTLATKHSATPCPPPDPTVTKTLLPPHGTGGWRPTPAPHAPPETGGP